MTRRFELKVFDVFQSLLHYASFRTFRLQISNIMNRHLLALLLIFSFINGGAQTYFFDNYKTTDGLESSKIYSICQLDNGYIWLGTDIGVSRFDGSEFINYSTNDSLAKGGARVLYKSQDSTLWIGHESGGLTKYKNNKFTRISNLPINSNITSFCQDKEGYLWITTYANGAIRISNPSEPEENIEFEQFIGKDLSDRVFNSMVSSEGNLYLITDIGIKEYNYQNHTFSRFVPENLDTYFQFSVMFQDSKKNFWYGTYNGGLYKQEIGSNKIHYYDTDSGIASNWITDIIEDKTGNIWISHWDLELRGGLTKIDTQSQFTVYNTGNGMHDNKIWSIIEDLEGNILIGTTEHGLDIYKGEKFISYTTKNGLVQNQVSSIIQDKDGHFWFGTNGGLSVYDPDKNQFTNYTQESNQISNQIRILKVDNNQNIWIGTEDQGIMMYDINRKAFVTKPEINLLLPKVSKAIWAMEIDDKNQLWIGTLGGLILYDINSNQYIKTLSQIDGLPSNEIKAIHKDQKGTIWVGTQNGGLSYFENNIFINIEFQEKISPICISSDTENNLIIGTEVNGIYKLKNGQIDRHFKIENGLFSNNIRFIITDNDNDIYGGTSNGLNKIKPSKNIVISYSNRSGYTGIESKANAAYKDDQGNLWLGTVTGVTCYKPSKDNTTPVPPIPFITNTLVNGEQIDIKQGQKFPHYKNNFLFSFSNVCVRNPSSVSYKIMLDGSDSDWMATDGEQTANYRALPPGNYTFKLLAVNSHGQVSRAKSEISFAILAPIYQRPWFIISSILIILIGIFTYIKIRERNLIIEKKILAQKVTERTIALSNANKELEEKNKDITDSIVYAKRIQFAIFTPKIPFNDTFLFFKPKDIVSGDFYWTGVYHGKEFLAVVDCTGHGVPGAFMSMIGHTALNKIIIEKGIIQPAEILNQLNIEVSNSLHQKDDDQINDGMDLCIISYDPQTKVLEYAGAYNPLWLLRDNIMETLIADRFSIGKNTPKENKFTNHEVLIQAHDMIYLFTDGFADQFGGSHGKKFKSANLKKLLTINGHLPMEEQVQLLDDTLASWKGDLEQLDDILVMGRRF